MKPRHRDHPDCRAISDVLQRLGDKWTVLVVSQLGEGAMRFNELRRTIGNISQKMLTTTLRDLEQDGFVTRTVYPTVPPRVEYALTDLGRDLLEPVHGLIEWAKANRERMDEAKRRFERAASSQPDKPLGLAAAS
ncbi:winged helix-turn-helix transcriptional regulator [Arvimicrobium flavum]|uniref:winged helix-turn-helix transcriptional regulator n=1 Tax=Arvimicrobium flavum TaxID=3393320 RepID=UPI00237AF937|nr:helix-turn-helix domain-containing protein [Mesorhizobium shangrilense]